MTASAKRSINWIVTGGVTRVGFRRFVVSHAQKLGIDGEVWNTPAAQVSIQGYGEEEKLAKLRQLVEVGPPGARIESVTDGEPKDCASFEGLGFHIQDKRKSAKSPSP